MEELSLDQIKKKSELEKDVDFENGDLWFLTVILLLLLLFKLFMVTFVFFHR